MAQITLDGLPAYSWPGGSIEGTLVLETDRPLRVADLTLALHGAEISQISIQVGKSREVLVGRYPFLDLVSSFKGNLPFADPEHVPPGTYRLPFRFDIPNDGEPSFATAPMPAVRGRLSSRQDGMYVEYELEARVEVPWWISPVDRVVIPVFSARRVLGTIPPMASPVVEDHPSFRIEFDAAAVLPGSAFGGTYSVTNPPQKRLGDLSLRIHRHVEYVAEGHSQHHELPEYRWAASLHGRESSYSGRFQLAIPNSADATGPFHGQLFRTWWMVHAELEVEFGVNVRVEASFTPA